MFQIVFKMLPCYGKFFCNFIARTLSGIRLKTKYAEGTYQTMFGRDCFEMDPTQNWTGSVHGRDSAVTVPFLDSVLLPGTLPGI